MDEATLREKQDQELIELLNEARVALSGASVLFGFLLIVPFSNRWERTTHGQREAYVIAFLATLLAVLALMLPTAYHRLRWRERSKERMLRFSHFGAVGGMLCLAVAMTATVYLVIDTVVSTHWAVAATVLTGAAFVFVWFALPLSTPYNRWDTDVETRDED